MNLFRGTSLFAIGTIISRISGLVREAILAYVFGASWLMDAFIVANRIPNLLRELTAEGALGASFTKVFSQLAASDQQKSIKFFHVTLLLVSGLMLLVTLLGVFYSDDLTTLLTLFDTKSNKKEFLQQARVLTQILFPFIAVMSLSAIVSGVAHYKGYFFATAISPIMLNAGYIIGALLFTGFIVSPLQLSGLNTVESLAVGVLCGGCAQLLLQILVIAPKYFNKLYIVSIKHVGAHLHKMLALMLPMILAASAGQINVLVNTNFATSLENGAVSWLNYAFRLVQLPVGVFAVALGTVSLPLLSQKINDKTAITKILQQAVELALWLMIPCTIMFIMHANDIITLIYTHGKFTTSSGEATAKALQCYTVGLVGYALIKVLTSYYYAAERTHYAMKVGIASIVINLFLNWILVTRWGFKGLALTSSIVLLVNGALLLLGLRKDQLQLDIKKFFSSILLLVLTSIVAVISLFAIKSLLASYMVYSPKMNAFIYLVCASIIVTGVFGYPFYYLFWRRRS